MSPFYLIRVFLMTLLLLLGTLSSTLADPVPPSHSKEENSIDSTQNLKESIEKNLKHKDESTPAVTERTKKNWRQAFKEIRSLSLSPDKDKKQRSKFLGQWKTLLDEYKDSTNRTDTLRALRFENIPSWERLLQEWAEDVADYFDRVDATVNDSPLHAEDESILQAALDEISSLKRRPKLPIPAPAKSGEAVLPHTDLRDKSKKIEIVTTASLPWRTGTAVNPLLRAAYLTRGRKEKGGQVTLMLPWLEKATDQRKVYGNTTFADPKEQEAYIRAWLRDEANLRQESEDLNIRWYKAWHNPAENSVYSMGDITALIPDEEADICILEEPEHLNWYRAPGISWTNKFNHVVGIMHTNYFQYALDQPAAIIRAPAMRLLCSWMCRAHCHRVIKLSGTLDKVCPEKELVENVHGVRGTFVDAGIELREKIRSPSIADDPVFGPNAEPKVYFIGKMLWSKGLGSLMELLKYAEESADLKVKVDMYGGGPDMKAAEAKSKKFGLDMPFHGPIDHGELVSTHKIFVNPSISEVLCTTSAEALAMGKFVILPSHPSNDFFAQFPNCLTYASEEEFVGNLYYALTHAPEPLSEEYTHALTWEAACERLEAASCIPEEESRLMKQALESDEKGIEISLPPLVESEEGRKAIADSQRRFQFFRTRLADEIKQNKVLPDNLKARLTAELYKRLDVNLDELFLSPKVRLQLSPAELDKALLELYDNISESPTGDVLRVISGAGQYGLQNWYLQRESLRRYSGLRRSQLEDRFELRGDRAASKWIREALSRNIRESSFDSSEQKAKDDPKLPRMCFTSRPELQPYKSVTSLRTVSQSSFCRRTNTFGLLI